MATRKPPPKPNNDHRCAVCWARFVNHLDWFTHVVDVHAATVGEFGYTICHGLQSLRKLWFCPGMQNALHMKAEGTIMRRRKTAPAPVTGKDGVTYTPVPLPL